MTDPAATRARTRYFIMTLVRLLGSGGAVLGLILLARAHDWPTKALGVGIVLAALYFVATVPAALAHRWRSGA